jgi:hypothetical protein
MNSKYPLLIGLLSFVTLFVTDCERGEFTWGKKIGDIVYSGNVVLMGNEELKSLTEVTVNGLVFSDKTGQLDNITTKSILVMGVSAKTPYGLLRRVSNIQAAGAGLVITTTEASLTDAIKEGTIQLHAKLLEKEFTLKSKAAGVLVKGSDKSFDGLAVTLDKFEVFKDGAKSVSLNGSVGVSPEIDITIKIVANEINEIKLTTTLSKIDEVTVSSNSAFSGQEEILAAEFTHSPIVVDSLVFVPEISISCGFSGTTSSPVVAGVRQDRGITSQVDYNNSRWSDGPFDHAETFDFVPPQITDNSDLNIFSGPELVVRLFGIPIQEVKADGFFSLVADKSMSPYWKLYIGNSGQNTVIGEFFGLRENYSQKIEVEPLEISNSNIK